MIRTMLLATTGLSLASGGALAQSPTAQQYAAADTAAAPAAPATESDASDAGGTLKEITVTATRRATSLQTTPVTVSAFTSDDLARKGIVRVDQVAAQVPNFYAQPGVANSSTISLSMRGHGDNAGGFGTTEQPVSFYFDDVFEARPSAVNQEFADIERVEVLRGPQGTLFGRNSMVGAVNVITRTPGDTQYGSVSLGYSNYQTVRAKAFYGTPLTDNLAVSLSGVYVHQGKGYMYDVTTNDDVDKRDFWGLRGKIHYYDHDHWDVVLSGGHSDNKNDGFVTTSYNATTRQPIPANDYFVTASPLDSAGRTKNNFADAHITGKFDGFTVRSITGWSSMKDYWLVDLTGGVPTPTGAYTTGYSRQSQMNQHQWTQETQIFGDALGGKASWIAGVYLFHEQVTQRIHDAFYLSSINATIPVAPFSYTISTYSYAGYAQGTYKILPKLEFVAGIRYTLEDKKIDGLVNPTTGFADHQSNDAVTPKFGLNYKMTPEIFLYSTVSKGFKAGSYNGGSTTVAVAEAPYRPETVWAYEIGAKTEWFDHKLRFNLAMFRNDFKDIVSGRFLPDSAIVVLYNGQSYRAQGVEAEVSMRPIPGLDVYANGGYQHISNAKFVAGSQDTMPASQPKYSGTAGWRYEIPAFGDTKLRFGSDWVFRGSFYGSNARYPWTLYSNISEINAEVTLVSAKGWQLSATGRNLTNRVEWKNSLDLVSFLGVASRQPQLPRTYGLEASYKF